MQTNIYWYICISLKSLSSVVLGLMINYIKTTLQLKVQNNTIQKDNNPSYLGVRLDPKLNFKTHFDDITTKVSKRLNLLKRLASSNWGTNKTTLRQLYSGYVRPTTSNS